MIKKDFKEISTDLKNCGQQVAELFHLSHYFFNLDTNGVSINNEIDKFISLIEGKNKEYPTQDEFGMNLAFQVSVRSNFPNGRHIGAAILSPCGEVISVASIRAPCPSSNPTLFDQSQIQDGYESYRERIETWKACLEEINENLAGDGEDKPKKIDEILNFLKDSLDFHPCTHAEIAAIIDAVIGHD